MPDYILTHAKVLIFHTKITAEDQEEAEFKAFDRDFEFQNNFPDIPNLPQETELYEVQDDENIWSLDLDDDEKERTE